MFTAAARRYVDLSNAADLEGALGMFAEDASYRSTQVGSFEGRDAIATMMTGFFERFRDAHWRVATYDEVAPNEVEFDFVMTARSSDTGQTIERRGTERISFDTRGKIVRVFVAVDPDPA